MNRLVGIALSGLGLSSAALIGGCLNQANLEDSRQPPPIILISIDTLRADHLGCYGYFRPTSPNLDRFTTEDAVLFEDVLNTGGGTLPIHVSMLTSIPPLAHDVFPENGKALHPARVTLADQLFEAGYTTAGFTGAGFMISKYGFDQGFGLFDDSGGDFKAIMPKASTWLDQNATENFFLFLHTYDVHSAWGKLPYDAPDGYNEMFTAEYDGEFSGCALGECASKLFAKLNKKVLAGEEILGDVITEADLAFIVGLYDGGIAYVDSELGRLFDKLKALDVYNDSLIVITSDHGEEFLDHRLLLHHQPYEEVARVPLLIKLPGQRFGGTRVSGLTSTLDIMPTILDVAGIAPNSEISGRSLLPRIEDRTAAPEYVFIAGGLEKLRTEEWSLLVANGKPVQLFDLESDPTEEENLLHELPVKVASLLRVFGRVRAEHLAQRKRLEEASRGGEVDLTQEEIERLEALGYVD